MAYSTWWKSPCLHTYPNKRSRCSSSSMLRSHWLTLNLGRGHSQHVRNACQLFTIETSGTCFLAASETWYPTTGAETCQLSWQKRTGASRLSTLHDSKAKTVLRHTQKNPDVLNRSSCSVWEPKIEQPWPCTHVSKALVFLLMLSSPPLGFLAIPNTQNSRATCW